MSNTQASAASSSSNTSVMYNNPHIVIRYKQVKYDKVLNQNITKFSKANGSTIEVDCWFPLKYTEPATKKKDKCGWIGARKIQKSRGGYWQAGTGKSLHEEYYAKKWENKDSPLYEIEKVQGWNYHVSHLCHHWWCCNPDHLVREPEWINQMRKGCSCSLYSDCTCHQVWHPLLSQEIIPCIWYTPRNLQNLQIDESNLIDINFVRQGIRQELFENEDTWYEFYELVKNILNIKLWQIY